MIVFRENVCMQAEKFEMFSNDRMKKGLVIRSFRKRTKFQSDFRIENQYVVKFDNNDM